MPETFKTIAQFQYSSEAQIVKGRLEADGIEVFLKDNYTIDTDPLVSNAIGGVKMFVFTEDADKATTILKSIKDYSVDNKGHNIICPKCKGEHIHLFSTIKDLKSFVSFIVGFFFGTLPFYTKHKYRCEDCKTEFDIR